MAGGRTPQRRLLLFAQDAEDVASGLHIFRDKLPRNATRITATISELFALSSVLREIDNAEGDVRFAASFYNVQDDLTLLFPSLARTLRDAFDMFARTRQQTYQSIWDSLSYQMEQDEGLGLLERLEVYHDFLRAQADILQRRRPQRVGERRQEIVMLWDAQQVSVLRAERRLINDSANAPLPQLVRPRLERLETPTSPVAASEAWSDPFAPSRARPAPPWAPDPPPPPVPTSPTQTSASSQTRASSQTTFSSDPNGLQFIHWAKDVFDGQNPTSQFYPQFQLNERSRCYADPNPGSIESLRRDGFVPALEIPFGREQIRIRFYFRPVDSRARLLFITTDERRRETYYCTKLIHIKIIREASSLQLCRAKGGKKYTLWARLNFGFYERMVLFYCTFVAMKRQDSQPVPLEDLLDNLELEGRQDVANENERLEYAGVVKHNDLRHELRLWKDQASGVVRLEASALRGPMKDVPLWTAFMTRYAKDPDHLQYEGEALVTIAALRPPPYVFLGGYHPPVNRNKEYTLQFTSDTDAREFFEVWNGLCRSSRG